MLAIHKRATAKSVPEPWSLMVRVMVVVPEKVRVEDPSSGRPRLMVFMRPGAIFVRPAYFFFGTNISASISPHFCAIR